MTIIVIIIDIREKEHKYAKFFDLFRCIFGYNCCTPEENKQKKTNKKQKQIWLHLQKSIALFMVESYFVGFGHNINV